MELSSNEEQAADSIQPKMLAKMYVFLGDFMTQGLTGPHGHIRGNEAMDYLLYYTTRHTCPATRQKRQEIQIRRGQQRTLPGLICPTHLLALVILEHSDHNKLKGMIGRLGIYWMMQDRASLTVQEGFCAGVQASKYLFAVCAREKITAEVRFLASFNSQFGKDLVQALMDIRPYLPEWAKGDPTLTSDPYKGNTVNIADIATASVPIIQLRGCVRPRSLQSTIEALKTWLQTGLTDEERSYYFTKWLLFWAAEINEITNHQEQTITQSLFFQSLDTVYRLHQGGTGNTADDTSVIAYLLLDIGNVRPSQEVHDQAQGVGIRGAPEWGPCINPAPWCPWRCKASQITNSLGK
ncbi:hypothetical protein F4859DRAFT_526111 [Xylaria cf. heliscus]|nr:hypothetical protein F4859DRAFT_526111 [Xylaria cf. heliscus]